MSCEQAPLVHALADGELRPDEAEEVRAHLGHCADCQAELADVMQLESMMAEVGRQRAAGGRQGALAQVMRLEQPLAEGSQEGRKERAGHAGHAALAEVRDAAEPREAKHRAAQEMGQVIPFQRRRRWQAIAGGAAAIAAAAALYAVVRPGGEGGARGGGGEGDEGSLVAQALPAQRTWEARLSWRAAAAHRPYAIVRDSDNAGGAIPLGALAALEQRGDAHGVGVLALLNGDLRQAETFLTKAAASGGERPDVLADRAALALAEGDATGALELTEAALAKNPKHAAATWNRALALRELGLLRSAAAAFAEVAALGEAGWSAEAAQREQALTAEADEQSSLTARVMAAGPKLAADPSALSVADAQRLPGLARLYLYDALRAATPAQLPKLVPLAEAIDGVLGVRDVTALAARASKIAAAHPALPATYAEMLAGKSPTGAARQKYLTVLRAAGAEDLLIAALVRLSSGGRVVDAADLPEFVKRTAASPDPWMQLYGLEQEAQAAVLADRLPEAEAILLRARQRCLGGGVAAPAFRCIRLGVLLGDVYGRWQRVSEARTEMLRTWKLARAEREWFAEGQLLTELANLAVVADDSAGSKLALARAYAGELVLRQPGSCEAAVRARHLIAQGLINQLRFDEARAELAAAPACDAPVSPAEAAHRIFVGVHLLREDASAEQIAAMRAQIEALRQSPGLPPAQRAVLDHCEGRLLIDGGPGRDAAAGEALLRQSIAAARQLPAAEATARKVVGFSTSVLALAHARRGDGAAAMAALAEEAGVPVPASCALALAVEDQRRMAVARDASGSWRVSYDEARASIDEQASAAISREVLDALAACPSVDVLARPPIHGASRLLPEAIAWRYRSARRDGAPELSSAASSPVASPSSSSPALIIADVEPPPSLGLSRLASWDDAHRATLSGAAATPARVLAALGEAGEVVIHAHGLGAAESAEASFLALSADAQGRYALTASDVREARLDRHPLVVLAACRASLGAPVLHEPWSLPAAFVYAGARAVVASTAPIPDREAGAFFDQIRSAVAAGSSVAVALRDVRQRHLASGGADWVRDVLVFE